MLVFFFALVMGNIFTAPFLSAEMWALLDSLFWVWLDGWLVQLRRMREERQRGVGMCIWNASVGVWN